MSNALFIFNLFIIAWGFFSFFLILSTPHGRPTAKYLLLFFIATQMIVGPFLAEAPVLPATLAHDPPHLFYLSGPAFYLYIKALRSPSFRFTPQQLWHLIPALLIELLFQRLLPASASYFPYGSLYLLIFVSWFLAYLVAGLRLLPGQGWSLRELLAPEKDTIWRWLYVPILFYIAVYALRFTLHLVELFAPVSEILRHWVASLTLVTRALFYFLILIGSYRHRNVYEIEEEDEGPAAEQKAEPAASEAAEGRRYRKPLLNDEQVQELWQRLEHYMSSKEPFLDTSLKLRQLAEALNVSANKLSQTINAGARQNFHDFVNRYRAQKAKELIERHADDDHPMLDLSLGAGFGNTATFYKYFKKYFLVTPAEYRRSFKKAGFSSGRARLEESR